MRLASWLTYPFRRGPRRPLSYRQPERPDTRDVPLGLEAVDMSIVESVNRRNASLERVNTFFAPKGRKGSYLEHAETRVSALPDDETYAARYHRAYNQKKGS
jgi:hypothetical protein